MLMIYNAEWQWQMTQNVKLLKMQSDSECKMTQNAH